MPERITIKGGAGPEETAAIASVIAAIEAEEKAALASRRRPILRSQWIEATRPLERMAPLPPEEYALRPGDPPDDHEMH